MSMVFCMSADEQLRSRIAEFVNAEEYIITRPKAGKEDRQIDIRQYVDNIETENDKIRVILKYNMNGSVKFEEIYKHIFGLDDLGETEVYREKFFRDEDGSIMGPEEV